MQLGHSSPSITLFQSTLSVRRATIRKVKMLVLREFQSTLSVRRATMGVGYARLHPTISIHALRKESDPSRMPSSPHSTDFNPRSP